MASRAVLLPVRPLHCLLCLHEALDRIKHLFPHICHLCRFPDPP